MATEGYLLVSDLMLADAPELEALSRGLNMKRPEARYPGTPLGTGGLPLGCHCNPGVTSQCCRGTTSLAEICAFAYTEGRVCV